MLFYSLLNGLYSIKKLQSIKYENPNNFHVLVSLDLLNKRTKVFGGFQGSVG